MRPVFFCRLIREGRCLIAEKKQARLFLAQKFPCFAFTEESMKCLRGEAGQRRAFIDEMLTGPAKKTKEDFVRVLKEKRQLLKDIGQKRISLREGGETLEALNGLFIQKALPLIQERLKILQALFLSVQDISRAFFPSPPPRLDFVYAFSNEGEERKNSDPLFLLTEDLRKKKEREIQAGIPLFGPQKHDIRFFSMGGTPVSFAPAGNKGLSRFLLFCLIS